jgi:DNA repair protein RAD16
MIGARTGSGKAQSAASRESLSSVSTPNDYDESSGYSTPGTSAFATPAPPKLSTGAETSTTRRGRRAPAPAETVEMTGISAVARALALRKSQYSLNPVSNKRKRTIISDSDKDDDEDLCADEDNTPDAQLARALQEQEDAATMSMADNGGYTSRRMPRKVQKILPKADFLSDAGLSDDGGAQSYSLSSTQPKIELGSKVSNAVLFSPEKPLLRSTRSIVIDSEASDDFVDFDDSEDEEPGGMATSRPLTRQIIGGRSRPFKVERPVGRRQRMMPPPPRFISNVTKHSLNPPGMEREDTKASTASSALSSIATPGITDSEFDSELEEFPDLVDSDNLTDLEFPDTDDLSDDGSTFPPVARAPRLPRRAARQMVNVLEDRHSQRARMERARLEAHHPELNTMWQDLENLPKIGSVKIDQPTNINRELKPFQLEGVAWMKAMEETEWGGGLLGDEMGMGKTIQAVSLVMSDFPARQPSLVLIPPVALMQWQQEIAAYTDGTLKTFVFHGTNAQTKGVTVEELMKYNVILMSYNSLESMYRKQEKGFRRKNGLHKEQSVIHQIQFHRVILDEAHNIKVGLFFPESRHH